MHNTVMIRIVLYVFSTIYKLFSIIIVLHVHNTYISIYYNYRFQLYLITTAHALSQ